MWLKNSNKCDAQENRLNISTNNTLKNEEEVFLLPLLSLD